MVNKVRLEKREIKSRELMDDFIREAKVVRIGMISRGEPYIVPLNFVYVNGTVFFHTASRGRKHDELKNGRRVCLEFDRMTGVDSNALDTFYTSVIAWGRALIVEDRSLSGKVLAMLVEKYIGKAGEITDNMIDRTCVCSVEIEEITGKENRA